MNAKTTPPPVRVLVVDDEPEVAEEMLEALSFQGIDGELAFSADEALSIIARDEAINAVVTDLKMPGTDGHAFLLKLMSRDTPPVVIVVTGHASAEIEKLVLAAGASRCFQKPCGMDDLAAALYELFENRTIHP